MVINMKIRNKNKSKKWLFLLPIGIVAVIAGYFAWQYTTAPEPNVDSDSSEAAADAASEEDRTYTETTEGEEVTVPDNVDPSSIKNYTLVTENETFKIRELDGEYYITLYAIINRPDQTDMYNDQLRQYKQDALRYLETHNVNITEVKLHYEPAEAANL